MWKAISGGGWLAGAAMAMTASAAAQDPPQVVASIKPIHSLVANVMAGAGVPQLIVDGAQSPHTYAMRPSNAAALQAADAVFWIGEGFETFLIRPLAALAGDARVIELSDITGLAGLGFRADGPFEADDHGDDDAGGIDQHLWLDPVNAAAMVAEIAATLGMLDPMRADLYAANGRATMTRIGSLAEEIAAELAGLEEVPFVVFHDAYQYFENRFDVHAVGSITVVPDTPPSARRVQEIHDRITATGAVCVFAEPQFNARTVDLVAEATGGRVGVLDPLGADIDAGPDHYFDLMRKMAATMGQCLAGGR